MSDFGDFQKVGNLWSSFVWILSSDEDKDDGDGDDDGHDDGVDSDGDDGDGVSRATLGHADCIPWVSCRYASSGLRGFSY